MARAHARRVAAHGGGRGLALLQRQLGEARAHGERRRRPVTLGAAVRVARVERGQAAPRAHVPG